MSVLRRDREREREREHKAQRMRPCRKETAEGGGSDYDQKSPWFWVKPDPLAD